MTPETTNNPALTITGEKVSRVADLMEAGVEPKQALKEAGVSLKTLEALPQLPPRLQKLIAEYGAANEELTKDAAIATLMEILDKGEDVEGAGTKMKAAKILLDAAKPAPGVQVGVFNAAPPPEEIESLRRSVEENND